MFCKYHFRRCFSTLCLTPKIGSVNSVLITDPYGHESYIIVAGVNGAKNCPGPFIMASYPIFLFRISKTQAEIIFSRIFINRVKNTFELVGTDVLKKSVSVYHLPQKSGNFGWNVNGKAILVCPTGKFPK